MRLCDSEKDVRPKKGSNTKVPETTLKGDWDTEKLDVRYCKLMIWANSLFDALSNLRNPITFLMDRQLKLRSFSLRL